MCLLFISFRIACLLNVYYSTVDFLPLLKDMKGSVYKALYNESRKEIAKIGTQSVKVWLAKSARLYFPRVKTTPQLILAVDNFVGYLK